MSFEDATLFAYLPFDIFQAFFCDKLLEGIINDRVGPMDSEIGTELRQQAVVKGGLKFLLSVLHVLTQEKSSIIITMPGELTFLSFHLKTFLNLLPFYRVKYYISFEIVQRSHWYFSGPIRPREKELQGSSNLE